MAMPQSEFWELTPREFANACNGYNERINRGYQISWEQARWVATIIVNINSPKKTYQPRDLQKFPWESDAIDREDELEKLKEYRKWRTRH